jgi:universal stress protein A
MEDYRHILFATDLGPECQLVGRRALSLARRYEAELTLIHVVEYMVAEPSYDLMVPSPTEVENNLVDSARGQIRAVARDLGIPGANCRVEMGTTKGEIVRVAEETGVDLIVVGSHGRHGIGLLLGSTANAVLHGAPCDTLAVRIPTEQG